MEELNIISLEDIRIYDITDNNVLCKSGLPIKVVEVIFTPTVPHCSMAGIIGLSIHFQLQKYLSNYFIVESLTKKI